MYYGAEFKNYNELVVEIE
ncbi:TPA: hypothetical protein ACTHCW_001865, partial [Streptococcus pyogenes]